MADGTTLNSPTVPGGDEIHTDEITAGGIAQGKKVQGVKLGVGGDGEFRELSDVDPLPTKEVVLDGRIMVYEDANFVVGSSPVTIDVRADLGRDGREVQINNDGPGDFRIEVSNDGVTFSPLLTLHSGERFSVDNLRIDTIRITWVSDSSYRVVVD